MGFVAFPLKVDSRAWLARFANPADSLVALLRIMCRTSRGGWQGSPDFGLKESLASLNSRHAARQEIINQVNRALADLGIDWAVIHSVEVEPGDGSEGVNYVFNFSCPGFENEHVRLGS